MWHIICIFVRIFKALLILLKIMLKKYTITCILMLGICVFTKMFGFNFAANITPSVFPDIEKSRRLAEIVFYEDFTFAREELPSADERIAYKMRKALKAHSYATLQTNKLHKRAEQWFPIIEPILKKYGIPDDFKYIPLIESGMLRNQYSPKGAAGLWQLMPETAKDYGLIVNDKVDERLNVKLATIVAAKYIRDLHKEFSSWTMTAAAYNGGQGRMKRQIQKQNQSNYFKLYLNHETGKYVYSLISMKQVIEHPEDYGYRVKNAPKLLAFIN
jgi:hypothetical protein